MMIIIIIIINLIIFMEFISVTFKRYVSEHLKDPIKLHRPTCVPQVPSLPIHLPFAEHHLTHIFAAETC
jgi:hypothetical protein